MTEIIEATYKIGLSADVPETEAREFACLSAERQARYQGFTLDQIHSVENVSTDAHAGAGEQLWRVQVTQYVDDSATASQERDHRADDR
jgi:hypothetical protein